MLFLASRLIDFNPKAEPLPANFTSSNFFCNSRAPFAAPFFPKKLVTLLPAFSAEVATLPKASLDTEPSLEKTVTPKSPTNDRVFKKLPVKNSTTGPKAPARSPPNWVAISATDADNCSKLLILVCEATSISAYLLVL